MSGFDSLTLALEGWFDTPMCELPDALRHRVEVDFFLMPWDHLSPDQRRSGVAQWDYLHDPATEHDRKFWWDFFVRNDRIKKEIETWEAVPVPTASDVAKREARLSELRRELDVMDKKQRNGRGDYLDPRSKRLDTSPVSGKADYIPYPKALKLLSERLNATPEEIAAWVWMGPNDGGLAGYLNANELQPPPRFFFDYSMDKDYLAALMACWFLVDDVTKFQPADRYITGMDLIERWSKQPGIKVEAFVRAKIAESRLLDMHPTMGATQWSAGNDFPTKEAALFTLAHVESIEVEDFGNDEIEMNATINLNSSVPAADIRFKFTVIKSDDENEEWWKKMMRNASDNGLNECRVGSGKKGPGGSLWRPDQIAGWLVDRHERNFEGMSNNSARAALKKFTGYEEIADEIFPKG